MTTDLPNAVPETHPRTKGDTLPTSGARNSVADDIVESDFGTVVDVASQWQLMRWKFSRHKAAVICLWIVGFIYFVGAFAEIIAPQDPNRTSGRHQYAPPQALHLMAADGSGLFLHVLDYKVETDQRTFRKSFVENPDKPIPVGFFVRGDKYRFWGLFEWDVHLIGPINPRHPFFLLGTDRLGRDNLSRIVHGTRVSMSIGLVGVAVSLVIGLILGGISGYYGGRVDQWIQRTIEFLRSMPTIPLWMGLAAAIPLTWDPLAVYFMITVLLSLIGWTSLARETRGKVMSLKNEDFVTAARLDGISEFRIITRQLLPAFMSHIIAVTTLAIPEMILAETALSFLGIGLRAPVVSWGVLLQEAQNVNTVATAPWLILPGVAVVIAVLALNFLGDGLRDAADPYSHN
jgi:peptide/nickel transport system permease protein